MTFRALATPPTFAALLMSFPETGFAWNETAHRELSARAADESNMASYLPQELRLDRGLDEPISRTGLLGLVTRRNVRTLIRQGSVDEDRPFLPPFRVRHHFHNPTVTWDIAGLISFGGQSSILWGQNTNQGRADLGGQHSWQDARQRLLQALTAGEAKDRQTAFADLFETLGHQIHLIQDAANPAHTRNDAHPALPFGKWIVGDPDRFHFWAEKRENFDRALVAPSGRDLPFLRPDPSLLARRPTDETLLPIARLIDTERYRAQYADKTAVPPVGLDIGVAEYSSAHFFSDDTILRDFDFPSLDMTVLDNGTIDPRTGRVRWYLLSRTLPTADVPAVSLATISALTWELPDLKKTSFKLNSKVFTDTARLLFPRAVGYSTALLDYFFRGRLDVNVKRPDPAYDDDGNRIDEDPALRQLFGVNGSDDTLGPGTLRIYADDPATGQRQPVLAPVADGPLGEVAIGVTPNGVAIVDSDGNPIRFRRPFDAARYAVVYTGTLGLEAPVPGVFVGAVVGKILGGERPEGLVLGDERKVFRSPDATLDLPPVVADGATQVQWGDLDNTFVGVASLDPSRPLPDRVSAFRIPRTPGTTAVPTTTQADGTAVLTTETLKSVNFPFGLSLDTTVTWTSTTRFKQALITFETTAVSVYGTDPVDNTDKYLVRSFEVGAPAVEVPLTQTLTFTDSFPVVLDAAHYSAGGIPPRPYAWRVAEVGLDTQQRLLALVEVQLTVPRDFVREVRLRALNGECELRDRETTAVAGSFPISNLMSAVIDVETGQVLGTTATANVSPRTSGDAYFQLVQAKSTSILQGGPTPGTTTTCADAGFATENPDYPTQERANLAMPPAGVTEQAVAGWYRTDLEGLIATSQEPVSDFGSAVFVYFVDSDAGVNNAVRLSGPVSRLTGYLTHIRDGVRIRPAATTNPQILLRFGRPVGIRLDEGEEAVLVQWSPASPGETKKALPDELPASSYTLIKATPRAALLRAASPFGDSTSLLVDLERGEVRRQFSRDLSAEFTLLAPALLYNVNDTEFYTLDLQQTALPRPLATGPTATQPLADFHVIVVP